MIGLIIATHADLARELVNATEMVIGSLHNVRAICIHREDGLEEIREAMARAIEEVGRDGEGVAIMTDMFGGTPANISLSFLEPEKVEVLTGVNLPMVLKFFNSREGVSLDELVGMLMAYGQQSIAKASEFLSGR